MDRRERAANLHADVRGLLGAESSLVGEAFLERVSAKELGPEADAAVVLVRAVHDEHVGVSNLGELARY